MKKLLVVLLCLLCLTGCVKNLDNIPALFLVEEQGEKWTLEKIEGYPRQGLREIWGDPQLEQCDGFGDVWFLDEAGEKRVTVRYDEKDRVTQVSETVPGQEGVPEEPTADEISGVAPPKPTDAALLSGPPVLTVLCGGESFQAIGGTFSWVTEYGILCADSPHPLQMQERMAEHAYLETAENRINFRFTDEEGGFNVCPEEIFARAWDADCTSECDHLSTSLSVEDRSAELLPGDKIYEITARWGDGGTSGGITTYMFRINKLYPGNE